MNREVAQGLSQELRDALDPLFAEIESLNERIAEYDRKIEQIAKEVYPQVALLKQVKGVGTLIALAYVLTVDDPYRFRRSRDAGCFVGLRPGRRNSGMSQPQLHISKEGDVYLRTMLEWLSRRFPVSENAVYRALPSSNEAKTYRVDLIKVL
ncbi:MAG: hypothetical protein DMG32_11265 [Acidobacteria bacterium]|nr:MAG: hypothetical protein DMG32_11265 [Acidobacteriota bacterium]